MQLGPVPLHDGRVWDLAFSDDGEFLVSGGEDGAVQVVDTATGGTLDGPPPGEASINAVLWAGDQVITGGDDGWVRIWQGDRLEAELGPNVAAITAMALSPSGVLAVADRVGSLRFWDLDDRTEQGEPLAADDNTIWALAWSSDESILAAASADEVVQLWDVASRMPIGALAPHPEEAKSVAFLSDGATIATTSGDGSVQLWDLTRLEPLGGPLAGHGASAWRVVALPDMRFASTSEDGTVRIWDVLNEDRACDRAAGPLGLEALGPFLGAGEEPLACLDR